MSCSAYKPLTSTENMAHYRMWPYDCGYSVFLPRTPGPGFEGTPFEDTLAWIAPYKEQVVAATALETRSGYPRSSYVPNDQATSLPPQFRLCLD